MKPTAHPVREGPAGERSSEGARKAPARAPSMDGPFARPIAGRAPSRVGAEIGRGRDRRASAVDRARLYAHLEAQIAEEAAVRRRSQTLLAVIRRNGRSDGEDQAELMFQLLRGRKRLPGGNLLATMALAGRMGRHSRRVKSKSGSPRGGRGQRFSKGLHPGLWGAGEGSGPNEPVYRPPEAPRRTQVGVVAVR